MTRLLEPQTMIFFFKLNGRAQNSNDIRSFFDTHKKYLYWIALHSYTGTDSDINNREGGELVHSKIKYLSHLSPAHDVFEINEDISPRVHSEIVQ